MGVVDVNPLGCGKFVFCKLASLGGGSQGMQALLVGVGAVGSLVPAKEAKGGVEAPQKEPASRNPWGGCREGR